MTYSSVFRRTRALLEKGLPRKLFVDGFVQKTRKQMNLVGGEANGNKSYR